MKRRDQAIVAIILVAALFAGLVLVRRALDRAAQTQADRLASAQYNSAAASGSSQEGSGQVPPAEEAPPQGESGSASTDPEEPDGGGEASQGGSGSGESSQTGASGEPVQSAPAGGGTMTLETLLEWMQEESGGALAARSMEEAEAALAAGVGTEADPLRRSFAQSQGERNRQARLNQLAEQAASLGLDYLRCRELAELREESAAFYRALEEAVAAQLEGDGEETQAGRTERVQADLETVREARERAELALEQARADLQGAVDALNAALGNPYGTQLEIAGVLTAPALPALTGDEAAAQALEQRNEIQAADYQLQREQQTLSQLRYSCAPDSPEVLEQQAAVQQAQANCAQAAVQVEADVRDRLTLLELQARELELLADSLERTGASAPEPDYVLEGGAEGAAWSSNLSALTGEWSAIQGNLDALTTGTAQLELDVLCFRHAIGVGCTAAVI